jgi:hypothetical protein
MAHYTPDFKYDRAKELIASLEGEQGDLVRYYIQQQEIHIENLNKRIKEMQTIFDGISKFTVRGNTIYG